MVTQTMRSATQGSTTSAASKNASLRSSSSRSRKPIRMAPALDLKSLTMDYDPKLEVPKRDRPMGLQDAPTYWPNDKEWADPLGYVQSIAEEGRKYGIIKVLFYRKNSKIAVLIPRIGHSTKRMETAIQCRHRGKISCPSREILILL
jgi:hypothetical protein